MYQFELSNLVINDDTTIPSRPLTVIIGPNNSGKSRLLKDILARVTSPAARFYVLKEADVSTPSSPNEFVKFVETNNYSLIKDLDANQLSIKYHGLGPSLTTEHTASVPILHHEENIFAKELQSQSSKGIALRKFESTFGPLLVALLSAENRLLLAKLRQSTASQRLAPSLLFSLYELGEEIDKEVSNELYSVFKKNIQLDCSALESLCIRVGSEFSDDSRDPRKARESLKATDLLDEQGDGLRSFASVVIAMAVARRPLWLIDEPEAFLHPPQAFLMGKFLAKYSTQCRRLFVSTHSVDLLRGMLSESKDMAIVRLTRDGDLNPCKVLSAERVKEVATNPLLSSSRVLDGLFYGAAVVTEADADSRLYQIISAKLSPGSDIHFVNAANKQTVPRIVSLYKDMGVHCIGVADFDVINDIREFRNHVECLGMPKNELESAISLQKDILDAVCKLGALDMLEKLTEKLRLLSSKVQDALDCTSSCDERDTRYKIYKSVHGLAKEIVETANPFQKCKELGRNALSENVRDKYDELEKLCFKSGLLINRHGELESMLTDYDIKYSTDKADWITNALGLLPHFERNDAKIIWQFVQAIHLLINVEVPPPKQ